MAPSAAPGAELAGTVRVAAFSSVGRSCVLPAMAGAPMSTLDSPPGSSPSGGGADALIDTFETEATVRMPG